MSVSSKYTFIQDFQRRLRCLMKPVEEINTEVYLNLSTKEELEFCELVYNIHFNPNNGEIIKAIKEAKSYFKKNKVNINPSCCANYCLNRICDYNYSNNEIASLLLSDERMTEPNDSLGLAAQKLVTLKLDGALPLIMNGFLEDIHKRWLEILVSFVKNKSTIFWDQKTVLSIAYWSTFSDFFNINIPVFYMVLDHPNFIVDISVLRTFLGRTFNLIYKHAVAMKQFLNHHKVIKVFDQKYFEWLVKYCFRYCNMYYHSVCFNRFLIHVKDRFDLSFENNFILWKIVDWINDKRKYRFCFSTFTICLVNDPNVIKLCKSDDLIQIKRLLINKDQIKKKLVKIYEKAPYYIYKTDMWRQLNNDALTHILQYAIPEAVESDINEVVDEIKRNYDTRETRSISKRIQNSSCDKDIVDLKNKKTKIY